MRSIFGVMLAILCVSFAAAQAAEHTDVVYKQTGHFAGWPANYGIWSWGNEILVGL